MTQQWADTSSFKEIRIVYYSFTMNELHAMDILLQIRGTTTPRYLAVPSPLWAVMQFLVNYAAQLIVNILK